MYNIKIIKVPIKNTQQKLSKTAHNTYKYCI